VPLFERAKKAASDIEAAATTLRHTTPASERRQIIRDTAESLSPDELRDLVFVLAGTIERFDFRAEGLRRAAAPSEATT
jgi:hypothetical protein